MKKKYSILLILSLVLIKIILTKLIIKYID